MGLCLLSVPALAQADRGNNALMNRFGGQQNRKHNHDADTIDVKTIPRGLSVWTVDERFGARRPATPDTLQYLFQNSVFAEGRTGLYNTTGNLGAPRISRRWEGEGYTMFASPFVFSKPYDFFLKDADRILFSNTKSPVTNLSYHSGGGKEEGDDRFSAFFATNAGKRLGFGFDLDYVYGRGFYQNQATSLFGARLFGSYIGDHYQLHLYYNRNHIKNSENGGLTSDEYITHPENFSTKYDTREMPVRLSKVWNYVDADAVFLTHRYNFGYYKQAKRPPVEASLPAAAPSAQTDTAHVAVFVPVASIFHTFKLSDNQRQYLDKGSNEGYYADQYINPGDTEQDQTKHLGIENTFGIEMTEGFKPWVKTGMRLYGKHEYQRFGLPDEVARNQNFVENLFSLGAELYRGKGKYFGYDVLGEIRTTGADWGEFNVQGNMRFAIPFAKDTLRIRAEGFIRNGRPTFYYRHYHGRYAWWDNDDLSKVFHAQAAGVFSYRRTSLRLAFETLQNYVYLAEYQDAGLSAESVSYGVRLNQHNKNIQVLSATLRQDFKLGVLRWENELTVQKTSDMSVLPLPVFTAWSNLYLKFRIAKVLDTEFGADVRYFTRYDAPTYSPILGQYVVQDEAHKVKIGNYPWVNVYLNFHLKHARFYVMLSHINALAEGGSYFLVPHYPTNPMKFRFGISWNFFN